jgi:hypothetical protein
MTGLENTQLPHFRVSIATLLGFTTASTQTSLKVPAVPTVETLLKWTNVEVNLNFARKALRKARTKSSHAPKTHVPTTISPHKLITLVSMTE